MADGLGRGVGRRDAAVPDRDDGAEHPRPPDARAQHLARVRARVDPDDPVLRHLAGPGDHPVAGLAIIDVTTGATTAAPEVVGLRSAEHSYVPYGGPLDTPDGSPSFHYV